MQNNNNHTKEELFIQIQGGKYKNKKIFLPSKNITRVTKSILKESFFNVIRSDICNSVFVEVFGGSGSVGLEAISQGAKKTFFIEHDHRAYVRLKQNCELANENEYELHNKDSFNFFGELIKNIYSNNSLGVDDGSNNLILYFDPPFASLNNNTYDKCLRVLKSIDEIQNKSNVLIVFERQSSFVLDEQINNFALVKTSKFGNSSLSYYQNKSL